MQKNCPLDLFRRVAYSLFICAVGMFVIFSNHIDLRDEIVSEFNGIEQVTSFITCSDVFFMKIKNTPAFRALVSMFVPEDQSAIVYSILSLLTISYMSFAFDSHTAYKSIGMPPLVKAFLFLLKIVTNFMLTFVANGFLALIFQHLPGISIPSSKPEITLPMSSDPSIRLLQVFILNDLFEAMVLLIFAFIQIYFLYKWVFKVVRKEIFELFVMFFTFLFALDYLGMTEMPIGLAIAITAIIKSCISLFLPKDELPVDG